MTQILPTPRPHDVQINGVPYRLIAFYYPGESPRRSDPYAAWDHIYQAPFLGNFWPGPAHLSVAGITETFQTAEAAFQATKWWHHDDLRGQFARTQTGYAAYALKKTLTGADSGYAGLGRDGAMRAVLDAKFSAADLKAALLATGDAYLLEHNETKGRDDYWSDDHDGNGQNRLGKELMALRDKLGRAPAPEGTYKVRDFTNQVNAR